MENVWLRGLEEIDMPTGIGPTGELTWETIQRKMIRLLRAYWHHMHATGHITAGELRTILDYIDYK